MGGFMGVAAKQDCVFDLYFGIDYHSHLGTRRGGMVVYDKEKGFDRSIHNIENAPFRTKFDKDMQSMKGKFGIGCISDYEPQPLIVRSHHGTYAITTVSKINNTDELVAEIFEKGGSHFLEMSGGEINATELIATLINQKENLVDGISYALEKVDGSVSLLLMNKNGIYSQEISTAELLLLSVKKRTHFVWRLNVSHTKTSATMIIKNSDRVRLR